MIFCSNYHHFFHDLSLGDSRYARRWWIFNSPTGLQQQTRNSKREKKKLVDNRGCIYNVKSRRGSCNKKKTTGLPSAFRNLKLKAATIPLQELAEYVDKTWITSTTWPLHPGAFTFKPYEQTTMQQIGTMASTVAPKERVSCPSTCWSRCCRSDWFPIESSAVSSKRCCDNYSPKSSSCETLAKNETSP